MSEKGITRDYGEPLSYHDKLGIIVDRDGIDVRPEITPLFLKRVAACVNAFARKEPRECVVVGKDELCGQDVCEVQIKHLNQANASLKEQLEKEQVSHAKTAFVVSALKAQLAVAREHLIAAGKHEIPCLPGIKVALALAALDNPLSSEDTGEKCQVCGQRYKARWRASFEAWKAVTGSDSEYGLYCINCFEELAGNKKIHLHWECEVGEWPIVKVALDNPQPGGVVLSEGTRDAIEELLTLGIENSHWDYIKQARVFIQKGPQSGKTLEELLTEARTTAQEE